MRKLAWFAIGFAAACILAVYWLGQSAALVLCAAAFAVGIGLHFMKNDICKRMAIGLLGLAVGLGWCCCYRQVFLRPLETLPAEEMEISAEVTDYPRTTAYGYSVSVKFCLDDKQYSAVLYYDADQAQELLPGDAVLCTAKLQSAEEKRKEDNFYYTSRGVWEIIYARSPLKVEKAQSLPLRYIPAWLGMQLRKEIKNCFSSDTEDLVLALLLGEKSGLSYGEKNTLSIAGIYHAVAVSGMHIAILVGMILLACGSKRKLAAAIGVPLVAVFVVMTGAPASAVRAGVMQLVLLLAPLARRENDTKTSLCFALLLLLVSNPWCIQNVGFQLSFTSTAGILFFAQPVHQRFYERVKKLHVLQKRSALGWLLRAMLTAFCTSLAASAFSLPLAAMQFEIVSLLAPLSNMLCLWAVTILFAGGLLAAMVGFLLPAAGAGLGWLLHFLAKYILAVTNLLAKVPFAAIYPDSTYLFAFGVLVYAALLLFVVCPKAFPIKISCGSLAAAFAVCVLLSRADFYAPSYTFTALDVGQGQCLVFSSAGDTTIIDCGGTADESGEKAARFLQSNTDFTVERLILTHYDADHCNGAVQLLKREKVKTLYLPDTDEGSSLRQEILQAAEEENTEVIFVRQDTELSTKAGTVEIFAPVSDKNDNDACLCVLAEAENYDILITGDLDMEAEYRLLSLHELPDCELYVAGHHGSAGSSSAALLERTKPETVFISVGTGNRYGHPSDAALGRFAEIGARVYRTDRNGTIQIRGNKLGKENS